VLMSFFVGTRFSTGSDDVRCSSIMRKKQRESRN
jgi:hypothetical protein